MKRSEMLRTIQIALEGTDLRTESPMGYHDKATIEDAESVLKAIEDELGYVWDEG